MKIRIIKDGPYVVSADVPLYRKSIVPHGEIYKLETIEQLHPEGDYYLCRCGESAHKPYCDGTHAKNNFDGTESGDMSNYDQRARRYRGNQLDILDDGRCAYARLCHRHGGNAWELAKNSGDPQNQTESIRGASECIAGRITAISKEGQLYEDRLEASVSIVQDPEEVVSACLYIAGGVPIESANGELYETRNRVALCRCGESENKPFCDAAHVDIGFNDGEEMLPK